jgi:hypothetical protein
MRKPTRSRTEYVQPGLTSIHGPVVAAFRAFAHVCGPTGTKAAGRANLRFIQSSVMSDFGQVADDF